MSRICFGVCVKIGHMLAKNKKVSFRNRRYYIKDTNIRVDLLVGLGVKEVLENYPWLEEKQVADALEFARDLIAQKGKREAPPRQVQTA